MHNILTIFINFFVVLQSALAIYILYLLLLCKATKLQIIIYIVILGLFIGLKFGLIPFVLGGVIDSFLWGTYNILYSLFIVSFLINKIWKK